MGMHDLYERLLNAPLVIDAPFVVHMSLPFEFVGVVILEHAAAELGCLRRGARRAGTALRYSTRSTDQGGAQARFAPQILKSVWAKL